MTAVETPGDDPWETHIDFMYEHFGRRDPDCTWCGRPVVMALQGFYSGGTWSTDSDDEGPHSAPSPEAMRCDESPDEEHDVAVRS